MKLCTATSMAPRIGRSATAGAFAERRSAPTWQGPVGLLANANAAIAPSPTAKPAIPAIAAMAPKPTNPSKPISSPALSNHPYTARIRTTVDTRGYRPRGNPV